jgi:hypothetical protein
MVALAVIVDYELRERMPQVQLAERDETVQALLFDRANKPFRMRVAIWRAKRYLDNLNT